MTPDIAVALLVAGVTLMLIILIILGVRWVLRRSAVSRYYHVKLPAGTRIRRRRKRDALDTGILQLAFPYWLASKKDGTRDRRSNSTAIIRPWSLIAVDRWELSGQNPFAIYDLALAMREHGTPVSRCAEENTKLNRLMEQDRLRRDATDINGILRAFHDQPTGFEPFCADLFHRFGFETETTPPSRDGGFDLRMSMGRETWIVECKCYAPNHPIGRPLVQKLYGANAIEHADHLMFITTSRFSMDAIEYASQVDVDLVDGNRLADLCRRAFNSAGNDDDGIPDEAAQLTREDILQYLPVDMRELY